MKLSLFKKLIRDVIREELDYKFSRLEEKLNEVVVSNNSNYIKEDKTVTTQDRTYRNLMEEKSIQPNTNRISNNNVSVPKTNNKVLNSLLAETAQGDEWKNINKEPEVKSVVDEAQNLPDHLADALTKALDGAGVRKHLGLTGQRIAFGRHEVTPDFVYTPEDPGPGAISGDFFHASPMVAENLGPKGTQAPLGPKGQQPFQHGSPARFVLCDSTKRPCHIPLILPIVRFTLRGPVTPPSNSTEQPTFEAAHK